jgi:hypothetical protein
MLKITGTMMMVLMLTALTASAAWVPLEVTSWDESTVQASYLDAKATINKSGLRYVDYHNNNMTYDLQDLSNKGTMWLSENVQTTHWISFGFETKVTVGEITAWNFNDLSQLSAGIQTFRVWYTQDPTSVDIEDRDWKKTWGDNDPPLTLTMNRATGSNYYQPNTTIDVAADLSLLNGIEITGLKLEVIDTYGSNQAGLSEIQFDGNEVPEPATMGLLAVGGMAMLRSRRRRNNK